MNVQNFSPRRSSLAVNGNLQHLLAGLCLGFLVSSFLSFLSIKPTEKTRLRQFLYPHDDESNVADRLGGIPLSRNGMDQGWGAVHVFYGNASRIIQSSRMPPRAMEHRHWFSQVRQDELVAGLLHNKRDGYFVDLAANDAIRISNTYALETSLEWRGLCIEANPVYWMGLVHRTRCITVAAVVGRTVGETVSFRFPNRSKPKGGIVGTGFDNANPSQYGEDQWRVTTTLQDILQRFHAPSVIDYMSLDVEGAEHFVLRDFPFEQYRFRLLTIERPNEELCRLLIKHKYRLLKQLKNWGETLWVHEYEQTTLDMTALQMDTENYIYSEIA